jgi:hypothetical protein
LRLTGRTFSRIKKVANPKYGKIAAIGWRGACGKKIEEIRIVKIKKGRATETIVGHPDDPVLVIRAG